MHYRSLNARINSGTKGFTLALCKKMVKIGLVTSEFKKGVCVIFAATGRQIMDFASCYAFLVFSRACRTLRCATQVVTFLSVRDKKLSEAQSPSNHSPSWAPLLIAAHRLAHP